MAVGDGCQGGLEIGEGLDAVDLAGFDQRGDATPGDAALVVAGEECVLAIEGDGADQVFDPVGVDLDAAVLQEGLLGHQRVGHVASVGTGACQWCQKDAVGQGERTYLKWIE